MLIIYGNGQVISFHYYCKYKFPLLYIIFFSRRNRNCIKFYEFYHIPYRIFFFFLKNEYHEMFIMQIFLNYLTDVYENKSHMYKKKFVLFLKSSL